MPEQLGLIAVERKRDALVEDLPTNRPAPSNLTKLEPGFDRASLLSLGRCTRTVVAEQMAAASREPAGKRAPVIRGRFSVKVENLDIDPKPAK